MDTFEEGTRKSRKTANKVLTNKAAHKRRKSDGLKEACLAFAACTETSKLPAECAW